MRLLVCGDRNWGDSTIIYQTLAYMHSHTPITLLIEGEALGADTLARTAAEALGILVARVPAEWDVYGKAAGPIRNKKMLSMKPDLVLAFHDDLENSKGTKNCVDQARKLGIPVQVVSHLNK